MNCAIHTDVPATAYCRTCGKALCDACQRDVMGVIYCESCIAAHLHGTFPSAAPGTMNPTGRGVLPPPPPGTPNPTFAALLGMIPGVGAMYNGQFIKGFVHVGIFAVAIYLTDHVSDFFAFSIPIWWFYMVFEAYKTAKARLYGEPLPDPLGLNALFGLGQEHVAPIPGAGQPVGSVPPPSVNSFVPPPAATDYGAHYNPSELRNVPIGAVVLIGLGVIFLLDNMGIFHHLARVFWPFLLIGLGLWIFYRRSMSPR